MSSHRQKEVSSHLHRHRQARDHPHRSTENLRRSTTPYHSTSSRSRVSQQQDTLVSLLDTSDTNSSSPISNSYTNVVSRFRHMPTSTITTDTTTFSRRPTVPPRLHFSFASSMVSSPQTFPLHPPSSNVMPSTPRARIPSHLMGNTVRPRSGHNLSTSST